MKPLDLDAGRTLIVAELSANHGGSLARAIETIQAAAAAGADAIKIQTYTADTLTIDCDSEWFRVRGGLWDGRTLYDLYREAHTPWEWHADLQRAAGDVGLAFFSTPFDATAVELLERLDVPAYKIASFELTDLELLACVAATRRPVVASTGMATREEIGEAVATLRSVWGDEPPTLALLRCVSAYPARPEDMNLNTIPELGRAFGAVPGLSDHTLGTTVATASVALGARIIEKHFTLDRSLGGPDSAFSLEPHELERLVTDVRCVEAALGGVRFGATEGEKSSRTFRRSIFAVRDVRKGETFTRENVAVIRPGFGLPPRRLPEVLGARASRDIARGTPVSDELLAR